MKIKDFVNDTDHLNPDMVMTVLVNGIAYPIDKIEVYQASAGKRLLIIPNTKMTGSIPKRKGLI